MLMKCTSVNILKQLILNPAEVKNEKDTWQKIFVDLKEIYLNVDSLKLNPTNRTHKFCNYPHLMNCHATL